MELLTKVTKMVSGKVSSLFPVRVGSFEHFLQLAQTNNPHEIRIHRQSWTKRYYPPLREFASIPVLYERGQCQVFRFNVGRSVVYKDCSSFVERTLTDLILKDAEFARSQNASAQERLSLLEERLPHAEIIRTA